MTLIEIDYLKPTGFKHFDVKGVMDFCKNHIIDEIKREQEPYLGEDEDIQEYIDANLPYRYDTVIQLVAECLSEYSQNGEFLMDDYEANVEISIIEFIFTDNVLDELLEELRKMLDPKHFVYKSWFEDDVREEWKAHINMMCDSIMRLKGGASHE